MVQEYCKHLKFNQYGIITLLFSWLIGEGIVFRNQVFSKNLVSHHRFLKTEFFEQWFGQFFSPKTRFSKGLILLLAFSNISTY